MLKRIMFLLALCVSLTVFSSCSYSGGGTPGDGNSASGSGTPVQSQPSSAAPTEEEVRQAISEILQEQIRLYEYGCYGTEYTGGKETPYLAGFAALHCQTNKIAYGGSDRQRLIRLGTKEYFDVTFPETVYFSDVGLDDTRLRIQPAETVIGEDTATVVVQKLWNDQELLDSRYTFKKTAMPQGFAGTIFEQLAYDGFIWTFEQVEVLKEPVDPEVVELSSAEDLIKFSQDVTARKPEAVNGSFVLTADIDLTDRPDFLPIGTYREQETFDQAALNLRAPMGFNGTFDGGGHTISGFNLEEHTKALGFFRALNDDAVVKDLQLQGRVVNHYTEDQNCGTGGFAGIVSTNAHIENCSFSGEVEGKSYVGGFLGKTSYLRDDITFDEGGFRTPEEGEYWTSGSGIIKDCTSTATVRTAYFGGGFAGGFYGNLDGCTANGDVIISKQYGGIPMIIGGFCGNTHTQLRNCHCNVTVTHFVDGANWMGNFVGELGRGDIIGCTISADVVNPDWFMVGMKLYLKAAVDITVVE